REAYLSRAKELLGYSQDWVIGVNRRLSEEKTSREPVRESKENQGTREVILISHAIAHQETEPFASGLSLIEPFDLSNPIARRLLELHRDGRSFTELLREEGLGERISAALTENNATEEDMRMSFVIMIMEARYNGLGRAITAAEAAGDRGTANAALAQKRFVLRIIDILRKIKERKALRYPERRNIILGKLWEIWEAITRGDDGRLAEVELDRLGRLLFRINEPVWDEEQTEKNKETETHGREKKR
ncbi:MAG: hypothetical protein ACPL68_06825, partial [Candidatus Hydrothermia bacterium]